jgi:hypothetical protein
VTTWSVPPWARSESIGELVLKLQDAFRRGDDLAVARRVYRLNHAVRAFDGLCRRFGCRDESSLDEARQRVLLRLYATTQRHAGETIANAEAFARTAAEWELRDLARERRRPETTFDESDPPSALERSGVHAAEDLFAKIEAERVLEEARRVLETHVARYRRAASRSGRGRLGEQHVAAWFMLRVQGRAAEDVARSLGVEEMAGGGRPLVWQWARRGRDVVLRLCDEDGDAVRARIMRAAAIGADDLQVSRSSVSQPPPSSRRAG